VYSNGTTAAVAAADYTLSGYNKNTKGNQTVIVTYQEKTNGFNVNVIDPNLPTVVKPTASPASGAVASGTTVTLATTTDGAEIWYTTNGTIPRKNGTGSTKYTTPIAITAATTIKAIAFKDGMNDSEELEAAYTIASGGTGDIDPNNITSVADLQTWLAAQTTTDEITVKLNLDGATLPVFTNDMFSGKKVNLDFSGSNFTDIPNQAFSNCTNLTGITLPDSVSTIGDRAFFRCTSLTEITIPDSVTSIGTSAFLACSSLTSLTIGNGVTSFNGFDFSGYKNLTSVSIGNGVTSIGIRAFENCTSLISITIPNKVDRIGNYAFSHCTSLTSVIIGSGVTVIGDLAFATCTNLTSVTFEGTIPAGSIGANFSNSAFDGDLRTKFYATDSVNGTPGTYTRTENEQGLYRWTKQN
jgi:hypothetical protein